MKEASCVLAHVYRLEAVSYTHLDVYKRQLFDTADDADEAEAEQYLSKLTAGEFSPLMYESKATARSEFAQFRQM